MNVWMVLRMALIHLQQASINHVFDLGRVDIVLLGQSNDRRRVRGVRLRLLGMIQCPLCCIIATLRTKPRTTTTSALMRLRDLSRAIGDVMPMVRVCHVSMLSTLGHAVNSRKPPSDQLSGASCCCLSLPGLEQFPFRQSDLGLNGNDTRIVTPIQALGCPRDFVPSHLFVRGAQAA